MKLTSKEIVAHINHSAIDKDNYIAEEVFQSMWKDIEKGDAIVTESKEKFDNTYDLQLTINGHNVPISFLQKLFINTEDYIKREAHNLIKKENDEIFEDIRRVKDEFTEVIDEVQNKLMEKYNINLDFDED
jgi:hypothetical protein